MFFMIDHVHSYSDCQINDSEASKIWDNLWKDSIKNGVKLLGRYGNRGAHRMFIIIEADSLEDEVFDLMPSNVLLQSLSCFFIKSGFFKK